MAHKTRTTKIRILLPVIGFACFLVFQFLKPDQQRTSDINTFLKSRLSKLVRGFDENRDGVLSRDELLSWFHAVDVSDKANELKVTWESSDRNGDGRITLNEYLEQVEFLAGDADFVISAKRRFRSADKDKDKGLTREEFAIFLFPELAPEMTRNLYEEEMADRDRNNDGHLSLSEYLGLTAAELAESEREGTKSHHIDYFRRHLDSDHDDNLSPDEILAWLSDDKRHLREKSAKTMRRLDGNGNGVLDIELEVFSKVKYFSEHELTRYGDLLFYQDEL